MESALLEVRGIESINQKVKSLRDALSPHPMYRKLKDVSDLRLFMEQHVFAVWDFMSLLKALQQELTCTQVPWMPNHHPELARFINEIVHGEESDVDESGTPKSHFDMYLESMEEVGADTAQIKAFLSHLGSADSVKLALKKVDAPQNVCDFVNFTFEVIESGEAHKIAAAFTFGREDLIPDMFEAIIRDGQEQGSLVSANKLRYYLHRHIEIDGDEHGPLALKMIATLCGNDQNKWEEAEEIACAALKQRIALWDGLAAAL